MLIRAPARLRKRLRQPAKPPEPATPPGNPLGEWYADIDFLDREPFVVLLNAATGAGMVLPGRAADLRMLHVHARDQFRKLLLHYGFDPDSPLCAAELSAWDEAPTYAATRDRSLLGSMNGFKDTPGTTSPTSTARCPMRLRGSGRDFSVIRRRRGPASATTTPPGSAPSTWWRPGCCLRVS